MNLLLSVANTATEQDSFEVSGAASGIQVGVLAFFTGVLVAANTFL